MKIVLEIDVDDVTGNEYQGFPHEYRQQLISDVKSLMQRATRGTRLAKLKQLIDEIRKHSGGEEIDAEILHSIIRTEDD